MTMTITNLTNQEYWFGPLHLAAGAGTATLQVDDTDETSLYLSDDGVADAINTLFASNLISVANAAQPFPRPTGSPQVLHGDGSPEGLVYAGQGSVYLRRDVASIFVKTSGVHLNTGWLLQVASSPGAPVTSLPASPADGQQAILVDSTTAPTYAWLFQYDAIVTDAYKWNFIGGSPAFVEVTAVESPGSTGAYVALTTAGPSFALPRAGNYDIEIGCGIAAVGNSTASGFMSYDIGGTGAVDADSVQGIGGSSNLFNGPQHYARTRVKTGLTGPPTLTAKYKSSSTNVTFQDRWMSVRPIRVS